MNLLTHNYVTRGFWGDEAWTAVISQLSLPEIIQVTGQDFHPPFYYLLVHGFIQFFGNSEWIRLISTLFFVLTLWPTYQLAKKLIGGATQAGKAVARVGTVLVAFSPILFIYAFEARSYALLTLMSVTTTFFFWQAIQEKKIKWWFLYAALAGVGVYTHYYLWFILASHGFFWLAMKRDQFWRVFTSYLAVLLIQLPWIPTLFSQVKTVVGDYWIGAINSRTHWEYFMRITAGDFVTAWQRPVARLILVGVGLSLVAVWVSGRVVTKNARCRSNQARHHLPEGYILLWFWWLIPVILPSLISLIKPVFFYRYLVFTSVPILLILLWGARAIKKELLYVVGALILLFYLKTDWLIFNDYPHSMREEMAAVFIVDGSDGDGSNGDSSNDKDTSDANENSPENLPENSPKNSPSAEQPIYTYLPSFAEVYFYVQVEAPAEGNDLGRGELGTAVPVKVIPEGLVQFSGRSLLDKYVEKGLVEIKNPDADESYWHFEPGPKSELIQP